MKFLIVFACFLAVAYGLSPAMLEKIKEQIKTAGGVCKTEVGAGDDDVAPLKAHQPPATQAAKCFVACMNKKFGFQDKSGKIDKDGTYATIEKMKAIDEELYGKMKQVADKCLSTVAEGADECETASNIIICVHKERDAAGIEGIDWQ